MENERPLSPLSFSTCGGPGGPERLSSLKSAFRQPESEHRCFQTGPYPFILVLLLSGSLLCWFCSLFLLVLLLLLHKKAAGVSAGVASYIRAYLNQASVLVGDAITRMGCWCRYQKL